MSGHRPDKKRFDVSGKNFALVVARWNSQVMERLLNGALGALADQSVSQSAISVFRVPGAFELSLAAQQAARSGRFDAIIALGCVIRGETPHFDYISGETTRSLGQVALQEAMPVAFGVLTVDNLEQALKRSENSMTNKGAEAALTALEILETLHQIKKKH